MYFSEYCPNGHYFVVLLDYFDKQVNLTLSSAGDGEPKIDAIFIQLAGFSGALEWLSALNK